MVLQIGPAVSGLASVLSPRGGAVWEAVRPASFQRGTALDNLASMPPVVSPLTPCGKQATAEIKTSENQRTTPPALLTSLEQNRNILNNSSHREFVMTEPFSVSDNTHYEQACDQAIAMCDGNLRSTIKALIMANEYLETELEELQAAVAAGCAPARTFSSDAA